MTATSTNPVQVASEVLATVRIGAVAASRVAVLDPGQPAFSHWLVELMLDVDRVHGHPSLLESSASGPNTGGIAGYPRDS